MYSWCAVDVRFWTAELSRIGYIMLLIGSDWTPLNLSSVFKV